MKILGMQSQMEWWKDDECTKGHLFLLDDLTGTRGNHTDGPSSFKKKNSFVYSKGSVAQWITRLPTEQKIPGSIPGRLVSFYLFY